MSSGRHCPSPRKLYLIQVLIIKKGDLINVIQKITTTATTTVTSIAAAATTIITATANTTTTSTTGNLYTLRASEYDK
jgi:hypothetical protein